MSDKLSQAERLDLANDPRMQDPQIRQQVFQTIDPADRAWIEEAVVGAKRPTDLNAMLQKAAGGALDYAKENPAEVGGMVGGIAAMPFTGGMSALPAIAVTGLSGAAGAGAGLGLERLFQGLKGDTQTPMDLTDTAKQMVTQGLMQAGGEGVGRAVMGAGVGLMNSTMPAAPSFRREFPATARTLVEEGVNPFSQRGVRRITAKTSAAREAVDAKLAAHDASRPRVAGYLNGATETIPLGDAPGPSGGASAVSTPNFINPHESTLGPLAHVVPERLLGNPTRQYLGSATQEAAGDAVSGPGVVVRRRLPGADPGRGAPPTMVDPRELLNGLSGARTGLENRAIPGDNKLEDLIRQFTEARTTPLSLTSTNAIKRAEQDLATQAYKAEMRGAPVNQVETQFHQGMANGAKGAIERRVPEIGPMNAKTQRLMGAQMAAENGAAQPMRLPDLKIQGIAGLTGGAGVAATGDPLSSLMAATIPLALGTPQISAPTAIALYKAGKIPLPLLTKIVGPEMLQQMGITGR